MKKDDATERARDLLRQHGHNAAVEAQVYAVSAMVRSDEAGYQLWTKVKKLIESIDRIAPEVRVQ